MGRSTYETRNTDCRDAERNDEGFWALAKLMERELYKPEEKRVRVPGVCAVCREALQHSWNVWYGETVEDLKVFHVEKGSEYEEKIKRGVEARNQVFKFPRHHCSILIDRWFFHPDLGRKISPADGADLLRAEARARAKAVSRGEDVSAVASPLTGVEMLEAMDV